MWFVLGLMVGGLAGVMVMAMMIASKDAEPHVFVNGSVDIS